MFSSTLVLFGVHSEGLPSSQSADDDVTLQLLGSRSRETMITLQTGSLSPALPSHAPARCGIVPL